MLAVAAALAILAVLLGVNALAIDNEAGAAKVTVRGGRILDLPGGDLQVLVKGPRADYPEALRTPSPIVLLHCLGCALDWWDGVIPNLSRYHRVIAIDLLGHGGSEKPTSGYSIGNQADLVAQALEKLKVHNAMVVGQSLGGAVAVALAERSPRLVRSLMLMDTLASHENEHLGLVSGLEDAPVIGEALWRVKSAAAIRSSLRDTFSPGFRVPEALLDDADRMTYNAYVESAAELNRYTEEEPLYLRIRDTRKPLRVLIAEDDPVMEHPFRTLTVYSGNVPESRTSMIATGGHSPAVESPTLTSQVMLSFDRVMEVDEILIPQHKCGNLC